MVLKLGVRENHIEIFKSQGEFFKKEFPNPENIFLKKYGTLEPEICTSNSFFADERKAWTS